MKSAAKIILSCFLLCLFLPLGADSLVSISPGERSADSSGAVQERVESPGSGAGQNDRMRTITTYQMVFTTLPLAFGLLHLILFLFFKEAKENLYFAIFLLFYSASIFFDYQNSLFSQIEQTYTYLRIHRAIQPFFNLFALRFVYSLFYGELPKRFWLFAVLLFGFGIFAVYSPMQEQGYRYFGWATIPVHIEIVRAIVDALRKKRDGAWLIALGFFIYYVFSTFDTLMDLGIGGIPFTEMENPYAFGTLGFLVVMSVYLARRYAHTQQRIFAQEVEHRVLEADNTRKTRELEEARNMQLAMLPACVNDLPGLDICFHMSPAAEVGGDYYDYLVDRDGSLVLAVGDATGHGMKAGIMVAAAKSLFQSIGTDPDIPAFFRRCTATLKQMHMGNLFMAMTLVRIEGNKLRASSAGMPPILLFKAGKQEVEEIVIKGPPLGGFADFSYAQEETDLAPGDTLLLMSDGFPELFNEEDEIIGYARAKEMFKQTAAKTPDEIVSHLYLEAERWRGKRDQEDDITFVALKIR